MFLFIWLEKYIRGGSTEETLAKMKAEQLKKGLHYTQQSHIKGSQPNKTEEQV
jgi:hypothetical protein